MNLQLIIILIIIMFAINYCFNSEKFKSMDGYVPSATKSSNMKQSNNMILPTMTPSVLPDSSVVQVSFLLNRSCGYCVNLMNGPLTKILEDLSQINNLQYNVIFSDEDKDNIFNKYSVNAVPACLIEKDGKFSMIVGGDIKTENIVNQVQMM